MFPQDKACTDPRTEQAFFQNNIIWVVHTHLSPIYKQAAGRICVPTGWLLLLWHYWYYHCHYFYVLLRQLTFLLDEPPNPEACSDVMIASNCVRSLYSQRELGITRNRTHYFRSQANSCSHWAMPLILRARFCSCAQHELVLFWI